ncbi:unnamed protein product [Paramecium sonneborni]|uniref:Transmembrane protein n=1 Tax=Paramecium sonneborni TaxID=65129 RepID=A0A8S1P493_9CILI|nr:unnamed protein product [Paramecium sonneborni]
MMDIQVINKQSQILSPKFSHTLLIKIAHLIIQLMIFKALKFILLIQPSIQLKAILIKQMLEKMVYLAFYQLYKLERKFMKNYQNQQALILIQIFNLI